MDEEERRIKLEAGKAKFAKFLKKKESGGVKRKKGRKLEISGTTTDLPPSDPLNGTKPSAGSSETYSEREDHLSQPDSESLTSECLSSRDEGDPKSSLSDELSLEDFPTNLSNVDQQSKCDLVIARQRILELQELVDGKNETVEMTLEENKDLKLQLTQMQHSFDSSLDAQTSLLDDDLTRKSSVSDCHTIVEQYSKKVEEYKKALNQREEIIQQLTERLVATLASRDEVQKDAIAQSESLAQEISLLKSQLKQATEVLLKQQTGSGISPQELLDARNEVLFLNRENIRKDALIQDLATKLKMANQDNENMQESFKLDLLHCQNKIQSLESEMHHERIRGILDITEGDDEAQNDIERYQFQALSADTSSQMASYTEKIDILNEENRQLNLKLSEMQGEIQLLRTLQPAINKNLPSFVEEGKGDFYNNSDDSCSSLGSPSKQQGLIGKELFNLIDLKEQEDVEIEDDFSKIEPCFIATPDSGKGRSSIYALHENEVGYFDSDSQTEPSTSELVGKSLSQENNENLDSKKLKANSVLLSLKAFESEKQALGSELENLGRLFAEVNELKLFLSEAKRATETIGSEVLDLSQMSSKISQLQLELDSEKLSTQNWLKELDLINESNKDLNCKLSALEENLNAKSLMFEKANFELQLYKKDVEKLEEYVNGPIITSYSFDTSIESIISVVKMFQELRSQNQCLNSVLEESEYSKAQLEKSLLQLTEKYKTELQEKELALITVSENCLDNHLKNLEISNTSNAFEHNIDEGAFAELERMSNAVSEVQVLNCRIQEIEDEKISLEHKLAQLSHDLEELVEANLELKSEKSRIENELSEKVSDLEDTSHDLEAHIDKLKMQLNLAESAKEELHREVNLMTEKHDKWLSMTRDQLIDTLPRYVVEEHRNCAASFLLLEERLRMETENKNAILAQLAYYSKRNEQHEKMYREVLKRYHEMKDLVRQLWDDRDKLKRELLEAKYEKGSLEANITSLKESLADLVSSKESQEISVKRVADLGGRSSDKEDKSGGRSFLGEEYNFQTSEVSEAQNQLISIFGDTLFKNINQIANLKTVYKIHLDEKAVQEKIAYFCCHETEQYSLYKAVIEKSRKTLKDLIWINNAVEALELDIQYEESEMRTRAMEILRCQNELSSLIDTAESETIVVKKVKDLGNETDGSANHSYKDYRFDLDESLCQKNEKDKKLMYETALQKLCDIENDLSSVLEKWNQLCVNYLEITVIKQKDVAKRDNLRNRLAEAISDKESRDISIKHVSILGGDDGINRQDEITNGYDILNQSQHFITGLNSSTEALHTDLTDDTQCRSQMNTVKHVEDLMDDHKGSDIDSEIDSQSKDSNHKTELFSDNSSIKEEIEEFTDSCMSDDLYNILENQFLSGTGNDLLENAEALITMAEMDVNNQIHEEKFENSGLTDNAQLLMELQNLQFDFIQKEIETHTVKMESAVRESYLEMIHKEKLVMLREILTKEKLESVYELRNKMNDFHEKVLFGTRIDLENEYAASENKLREEFNQKLREINNSYTEKLKSLESLANEINENNSEPTFSNKDFKDSVLNAINEATLDAKIVEINDKMYREMSKYKEDVEKRYSDQAKIAKEISDIKKQIEAQVSEKTIYSSETYTQTATPFFKVVNDIAKDVTEHLNKLIKRWSSNVSFNLHSLPNLETIFRPVSVDGHTSSDDSAKIIALQNASVILDQKEKFLHEAKDMQDYLENYSSHVKKLLKAMENDYELILLKKEEIDRECTEISDKEIQTDFIEAEVEFKEVKDDLVSREEFWQASSNPSQDLTHSELDSMRKEVEDKFELEIVKLCSENANKVKEIIDKHNLEKKALTQELELMREKHRETGDLGLEMSDLIEDHKVEVDNLRSQLKQAQDEIYKLQKQLSEAIETSESESEALKKELNYEKEKLSHVGDLGMQMSDLIQDHQSEVENLKFLLKEAKNEGAKWENEAKKLQPQIDELKTGVDSLNKQLNAIEEAHSSEIQEHNEKHLKEKEEWQSSLENIKESHNREINLLKDEMDLMKIGFNDEKENALKRLKEEHNGEVQNLSFKISSLEEKLSEFKKLQLTFTNVKEIYNYLIAKFVEYCLQISTNLDEDSIKISAEGFTSNVIHQLNEFENSPKELEDLERKIQNLQLSMALNLETLVRDKQTEFNKESPDTAITILKAEMDSMKIGFQNEKEKALKDLKEEHNVEIQNLSSKISSLEENLAEFEKLKLTFSNVKLIYNYLIAKFIEYCLQTSTNLDEDNIKTSAEDFTKNVVNQLNEFENSPEEFENLEGKILTLQQTLALDLETLIHDKQREVGSRVSYNDAEATDNSMVSLSAVEQLKIEIQQSMTTQKHENEMLSNEIGVLKNQIIELEYVNSSLQEDLLKSNSSKNDSKSSRHTAQTNNRLMNVLSDLVKTFVDTEQTIQNHLSSLGLSVHQSSEGGSLIDEENGPLSGTFHGSREDCTLSSLGDALPLEMCDDITDLTPRAWDAVTNAISGMQQEPETEGEDVVLGASRRLRAAVDHILSLLSELIENSQNPEITDLILKNHKLVVMLKEESQVKSQLQYALNKAEDILASMRSEDGAVSKLNSTQGARSKVNVSPETSPKQVQCLRKSKEDIIEDTTVPESYSALLKRDIESLTQANSGEMQEDWKQLLKRIHYLELALEEISNQKDEIAEEKQKEIDDLKEQMEAMEKQMQSNKRFIEEQVHEREQEQEDFFQELEKIRESLREREKTQSNDGQLLGEVELLEQQLKLKSQSCDDLRDKMAEFESQLQSAKDKVNDLQEVISEMENQLENKNKLNEDLNQELGTLREFMTEHEQVQTEMTRQIEELKTSLSKEYSDHIASLEEQLQSKNQEMEQMSHCQTLMQEFRSQIHVLDERLESKIRMLEYFSWHLSPGTSEENSLSDSKDQEDRLLLIQEGRVLSPRSIHGEEIKKLETKIDSLLNATDEAIKRLKDSETQIRDMKFKSDELQTERSLLQQQLSDQLYQISTFKTRMDDARYDVKSKVSSKEFAQLKENLSLEKERVIELKQELETYQKNYPKVQNQLRDKNAALSKLEENIFKCTTDNENLEKENCKIKDELNRLQEQIKVLLIEKERISNEFQEVKTVNENLVQSQESKTFPGTQEVNVQTDMESASVVALQNDVKNLKESLLSEEKLKLACKKDINDLKSEISKLNEVVQEFQQKVAKQDEALSVKNKELSKLSREYNEQMDEKRQDIEKLKLAETNMQKKIAENAKQVEDRFRQKLDSESKALSDTYEQSLMKIREQHERSMKELEDTLSQSFLKELAAIKASHELEMADESKKWTKKLGESSGSHLSNQKFIMDDYDGQLQKLVDEMKTCKASLAKSEGIIALREMELKEMREKSNKKFIMDDYEGQIEKLVDEMKTCKTSLAKSEGIIALREMELKEMREKCRILEDELERFKNNLFISRDSTPESDATGSSRATSTDEGSVDSVKLPSHMQQLFDKVLKEGLEVLSLTERKQITHHVNEEPENANFNDKTPLYYELWLKAKDQLLEEVQALKEITIVENQGSNDESIAVILQDFLKREKNRLLMELQTYSMKEGHQVLSTCKELEEKIYSLEDRQEATLKELYDLVHSQLSKEKANNVQMEQEILLLKDQVEKGAWQIKKQRELLDYKVKQEKMLRDEFQSTLDREQVNNEQLTQQLRQLRSRSSELELSLALRQAEFQKMQNELDRARKECENFKSVAEAEKNHANALLQALEAERVNFSQIHMALDSEREHRKTLLSRDQQIINKLQASVDVHSYAESISSRTLSPEVPRYRDDNSSNLVLSPIHHHNSSVVQVKEKCLKCGFYENILSQERSNWKKHEETMTKLLQSAENEVAQLKQRILLSNSSSKNDASSQRQKLLQVHWKYRKSEKHRMSLVYQKRYLLKLLQGYQKTEKATLSVLNEMGVCSPTSSTQGSIFEEYGQSYFSDSRVGVPKKKKRIKFRSVVKLVIGTIRFRFLLDRSNQAQQFFIYGKQQQMATNEVLPITNTPKFAPYNEPYGLSHLFSSTSCSSSSSTSSKYLTNKMHQIVFDPSTVQLEKHTNQSCGSIKSDVSNSDLPRGQRIEENFVLRLEAMHKALGL